jgi:hypothetical protein
MLMTFFPYRQKTCWSPTRRTVLGRGFSREAQLPKLIGLWPSEVMDYSLEGTERIVAQLRKAIRAERRRAQQGHWTYDINRHLALADALKAEEARLAGLRKPSNGTAGGAAGPLVRMQAILHMPAAGQNEPSDHKGS